jgi:hypothetical protein
MNLLYNIYYWLPNFAKLGYPGKVVNYILLKILKKSFDFHVPRHLKKTASKAGMGINTGEPRDRKYIVSLTSFPARIDDIWISIETILRQSFKPDMIILWLAEEQFPDKKLPLSLLDLQERGLTIRYCDDIRSHKKYYYTIKEFPEDYVITLDDDLYYDKDVLKNVVEMHRKFPDMIATNRAHKMTFDEFGNVKPYRQWKHNDDSELKPSHRLLQTGGAGTLYFPGCLHSSAFDKELIKELCFHADDVWLKMMAYMNGHKVITNSKYNKDYVTVSSTQNEKLVTQNVFDGGNDRQLKNIINHFKINFHE